MNNKKKVLLYDSAVGIGTDSSVDPNPTKDPNNYLAPRADSIPLVQYLLIIALVVAIAFMYVELLKELKSI